MLSLHSLLVADVGNLHVLIALTFCMLGTMCQDCTEAPVIPMFLGLEHVRAPC